jgi:hypothetical protein
MQNYQNILFNKGMVLAWTRKKDHEAPKGALGLLVGHPKGNITKILI